MDSKLGLHIRKNGILTVFLKMSPMKVHRDIYEENVTKRGGYYTGSLTPPPNIIEDILSGEALTFLSDVTMAPYRHMFTELKEEVSSGQIGKAWSRE